MESSEEDGESKEEANSLLFQFSASNGLQFESREDGRIECGKCRKTFVQIISHLKNSC